MDSEKRRPGRPRIIFKSDEEKLAYFKKKKEKNKLAASKLRTRKRQEDFSHKKELQELEANVSKKRQFVEFLDDKVKKLRSRIEFMMKEKNVPISDSQNLNKNN